MKRFVRCLLSSFLIFGFFSCTLANSDLTGSVSFSADKMLEHAARYGGEENINLKVIVSGGYSDTVTVSGLGKDDIGTDKTKVYIDGIPLGSVIDVSVQLFEKDVPIFEGEINDFKMYFTENNFTVYLRKAVVPGWYILWQKYDQNVDYEANDTWAHHPNPKFSIYREMPSADVNYSDGIYSSNNLLIDFCFDENHNLYTLEADATYGDNNHTWTISKIYVNKYIYSKSDSAPEIKKLKEIDAADGTYMDCITTDGKDVYIAGGAADGEKIFTIPCNGEGQLQAYPVSLEARKINCIETSKDSEVVYAGIESTSDSLGSERNQIGIFDKKDCCLAPVNWSVPAFGVDKEGITDMQLVDNTLYIIAKASEKGSLFSYDITKKSFYNDKPQTLITDSLLGPKKFIAIKPKKLIIAGDGSTKNKILTIDLGEPSQIAEMVELNNINFDGIYACGYYE